MAWLEESLAQDALAVPAALLAPEPPSAAAGYALVSAANDSIKQGEGREACSQRLLNADVAHALLFTTSPLPHSPCCLPPLPLSLDMPPLSRAANPRSACSPLASAVLIPVTTEADFFKLRLYPPSTNPPPSSHAAGSACTPLATAVVIQVTTEADFIKRRLYPPSTTVILELQNHVTLKRGLLFGPKYACIVLLLSDLSCRGDPMLQREVLCAVVSGGIWMSQPFRAYSQACPGEIPDVGTDIICPLIHVYRSYGVQIVKGYTFGRVDVVRTMHSRIDSMRMTGVSDFKRGNGVIRVMLSGYGPLLVRAYVYITNNEIYGAYLPVMFQLGVVGAVFKNNYVHDYVWAAIVCGNMVHSQGDCMLTSISNNLVVAKGRNLTGGGDATGIYYVTHWNNPGNLAECNYIIGGDHCYYLDYASSGVTIRGGACIGTVDGMKVNNGKWNLIQHVVMKGTEGTPGWCACLTATICNCLKDPGNYWDRMRAKYYSTAVFQQ
ncbi:unnamed protein product, partial [Closterium sp. Naga37s-1]